MSKNTIYLVTSPYTNAVKVGVWSNDYESLYGRYITYYANNLELYTFACPVPNTTIEKDFLNNFNSFCICKELFRKNKLNEYVNFLEQKTKCKPERYINLKKRTHNHGLYHCPRCGYESKKHNMRTHFSRKKLCKPVVSHIKLTSREKHQILDGSFEKSDDDFINIDYENPLWEKSQRIVTYLTNSVLHEYENYLVNKCADQMQTGYRTYLISEFYKFLVTFLQEPFYDDKENLYLQVKNTTTLREIEYLRMNVMNLVQNKLENNTENLIKNILGLINMDNGFRECLFCDKRILICENICEVCEICNAPE